MRDTVVRPLKRPLKGRREVEALIGERKNHTFDVWIVISFTISLAFSSAVSMVRILFCNEFLSLTKSAISLSSSVLIASWYSV